MAILTNAVQRTVDSQSMKSLSLFLFSTFFFVCLVDTARTQNLGEYVESYTARLSARDHFNSSGQRLREPGAIIRQDRANFYVYGLRDSEDQPDSYFSSKAIVPGWNKCLKTVEQLGKQLTLLLMERR
jgi:hypothetical protein